MTKSEIRGICCLDCFLLCHCVYCCSLFHFLSHKAQNRTTYYAPNQLAQMRPNPRWQQQGGRGQGEGEAHDPASFCNIRKQIGMMKSVFLLCFRHSQVVSRECRARCVSQDLAPTWGTCRPAAAHRAQEVWLYRFDWKTHSLLWLIFEFFRFAASCWTGHGPSSINGSTRSPNHGSLQICLQCPQPKSPSGATYCPTAGIHITVLKCFTLIKVIVFKAIVLFLQGSAGCPHSGPGATYSLHAGCCTPSRAEADAR